MLTAFIYLVNGLNFLYIFGWPLYNVIRVGLVLRARADEIKFLFEDGSHLFQEDDVPIKEIRYIVAQLWIDNDTFYEWKMTPEGDILKISPRRIERENRPKWLMRERMIYWKRRSSDDTDSFMKYRIRRSFSTRGLMGWIIRRYTAEAFVMAKMAGFERYRFTDYIRQ